jgi:starch synthase
VDNITNGRATGIVFEEPMPEALAEAVARACALYEDTESLHAVRVAGMKQDFSWDRSAKAYVELYRAAIGIP